MKDRIVVRGWDRTSLITDRIRRQLLEQLIADARTSKDVAKGLGITQQLANYHLQKLMDAGLVESTEEKKGHFTYHIYRAAAREFEFAPVVIGVPEENKNKEGVGPAARRKKSRI